MLGIIVLILFVIVETAFLVGLAYQRPEVHRWTNPIGIIGVPVLLYGLYTAFNGHGIKTTAVVVLLVSLVLLIVATELQMQAMNTVHPVALVGQILAVALLIPSFWLAISGMEVVPNKTKVIATIAFFAYEALTIVYLAIPSSETVPADKARARDKTKAGVMISLVLSVSVFGLGLGLMLEMVGAL